MENESGQETIATQGEIKRPKKKKKKEETLFDRRINWIKNHRFLSWVLVIATVGGALVTIITMWGNAVPRIENFVHDVSPKNSSEGNQQTMGIIKNYYADLKNGRFKAVNYFASQVEKYILVADVTPTDIDKYYIASTKEFLDPQSDVLDSTFTFFKDASGNQAVDVWINFTCFRSSKGKYELCPTRTEFVFDKDNKIKKLTEIDHKKIQYIDKELVFEGSVGKLSAVFNLVFDYGNKKISGTYYYPTRIGVVYSMTGTITGNKIELAEYTNGVKTATCKLQTFDQKSFNGTMFNTDGRQLKIIMRTAETLFL